MNKSDYGHPFSIENGMLYYKERRPLMLGCLISFLICKKMIIDASDSIYMSPHDPHHAICSQNNFHLSCKKPDFGQPLNTGNGISCYKEIHPLLLECLIFFVKCTSMIGRASDGIYELSWSTSCHFCPKKTHKFHQNIRFWAPFQHRKWDAMLF